MKRFFIVINLLFLSVYCFSQQNMPGRIIGQIPNNNSAKLYQIQVGAFKLIHNAEAVHFKLKREGFIPVYEKYFDYTRVKITGISANQVSNYLTKLKQIGFEEVIIREDISHNAISEKWEITTSGSAYSSFEFNQDYNYIAIKNEEFGESEKLVYFGEYTMPAKDVIQMDKLGVLRIRSDNGNNVSLSFSPLDEPGKEISFTASKAEKMQESAEIDLFCRTWKVVNCTDTYFIDNVILISKAGTYFFTTPDGESGSLSQWRWYNNNNEEFDYTHDNWEHYGRVKILELTKNYLKILDPGFNGYIPGYSSAGANDIWELVPITNE